MSNLAKKLLANPGLIEDYKAKRASAADLAKHFRHSESYVLSTLSRIGVKRPVDPNSTYKIQKEAAILSETRREFRTFLAEKVVQGQMTAEKASQIANCSERTMFRYVSQVKQGKK